MLVAGGLVVGLLGPGMPTDLRVACGMDTLDERPFVIALERFDANACGRAFIAQQLIPTVDGLGRRAAIEVLINTPLVSDLIRKGEVHTLKELMERSTELGMQTFDQSLYQLYMDGVISYEHALARR